MTKSRSLISIVDDDAGMRKALQRFFRGSGLDVETFASGAAFLESLQNHLPDGVLLDVDMPSLDGFAVQERLNQAGIRLPIIIITGKPSEAGRARALAGGASDYLNKIEGAEAMLKAITAAIAHPPGASPVPEERQPC